MPACWKCAVDAGDEPFCPACHVLQPARPRDAFAVLKLGPPRFHLEEASIEKAWREQSRTLHPDRFAKADPKERRYSLEHTTLLNDARKQLKNAVKRAEYLFRQVGFTVPGDEAGRPGAGQALPLEFYEQVMEDREALMDARSEGPEAVARLAARVESQKAQALATVDAAFTAWENGADASTLAPALVELAKLKYFDRFLDEVAGRPHD